MQLIVELCAQINVSIYLCTNTLLVIMSTAVIHAPGEGLLHLSRDKQEISVMFSSQFASKEV